MNRPVKVHNPLIIKAYYISHIKMPIMRNGQNSNILVYYGIIDKLLIPAHEHMGILTFVAFASPTSGFGVPISNASDV